MFERYTEKVQRVIFFARHEASQYGSPYIEAEHLLLGVMREDKYLANHLRRSHISIESIRQEIESRITIRERISTSAEVPLTHECKRILHFAAEEAERLGEKHVSVAHLLLGILREEKCLAAEILTKQGLRLSSLRKEMARGLVDVGLDRSVQSGPAPQSSEVSQKTFVYNGLPNRVIFGFGTRRQTADEVRRLGVQRPLLLTTPQQREQALGAELGFEPVGVFSEAAMHTPLAVTEKALGVVAATRADGVLSFGGGSTTGLGKAIALRTDLPQVVLPTTYAGSEMTDILGETAGGAKKTIRSPNVQPEVAIYDVELTFTLPAKLSAASGMNAMAHAVEGLYAQDANPIVTLLALAGIDALAKGLPEIVVHPQDRGARAQALYGAWLCGTVLGSVKMALHHKLCHVLGGSFDLPHAETHTVVLPHVASLNARTARAELAPVSEILHSVGPGQGLFDLAKRIGAPTSLKEIGMPKEGLDRAAELATESPYYNPRTATREEIRSLLEDVYWGRRPEL
jgi:alcohol dehydrogenase class IV